MLTLEEKEVTVNGYSFTRKVWIEEETVLDEIISHKVAILYYVGDKIARFIVVEAGKTITDSGINKLVDSYEKTYMLKVLEDYLKESEW